MTSWPPNEERVLLTLQRYRKGQIIQPMKNRFFRVVDKAFFGSYIVRPYDPSGRNNRVA